MSFGVLIFLSWLVFEANVYYARSHDLRVFQVILSIYFIAYSYSYSDLGQACMAYGIGITIPVNRRVGASAKYVQLMDEIN